MTVGVKGRFPTNDRRGSFLVLIRLVGEEKGSPKGRNQNEKGTRADVIFDALKTRKGFEEIHSGANGSWKEVLTRKGGTRQEYKADSFFGTCSDSHNWPSEIPEVRDGERRKNTKGIGNVSPENRPLGGKRGWNSRRVYGTREKQTTKRGTRCREPHDVFDRPSKKLPMGGDSNVKGGCRTNPAAVFTSEGWER